MTPASILVVDDSPDVLLASTRALTRMGHQVRAAGSVQEAETCWNEQTPDLVLLDVNLPDGNGILTCHAWKSDPGRVMVPVILRSAVSVSAAEQSLGLRSGADGYLTEPVESEVLAATVAAHLRIKDLIGDLDRGREQAADLVRYSLSLAQAASPEDVVRLFMIESVRALHACDARLTWRRWDSLKEHRHSAPHGSASPVLDRLTPLAGASQPTFLADASLLPLNLDDGGDPSVPSDECSWALIPFDDIGVTGFIAIACAEPQAFDRAQQQLFLTFAAITALSLARAATSQLYLSIASTLQQALVPPASLRPDVQLSRRLIVAEGATIAGGDWFDGYALPSGRQAVICGDVVGHGPQAAAVSSVFRHTLRTLLLSGMPVGRAIHQTRELLSTHPSDPQGSLLVAEILPDTCEVSLHSAGHLPPILISGGRAAPASLRPAPPLGLGLEAAPPAAAVHPLRPGDVLLLITDGVIERRRQGLDQGYRALCSALDGAHGIGAAMAAVDRHIGDEALHDDALFVAVSVTTCVDARKVSPAARRSGVLSPR